MNSRYKKSKEMLLRSEKVIPLGSQTFSKSKIQFPNGHAPLFLERGQAGHVWDIDGNEYIDMVSGLLPVLLGYCDPDIDNAIIDQIKYGITLSLPSVLETELSELLVKVIPCAEMVRFGKNGTDATSAAIRLSRAYTKKEHIIVLGYHGWQDWYIGSTTRNKGVPESVINLTHKAPFNDIDAIKVLFNKFPNDIAAVILEPIGMEWPNPGYLEELRELTERYKSVLIFDEVITGFRFSLGGAQEILGVTPDLATFGKALGNGMPISAVVGKRGIMMEMENIFYSGTFSGETLSLAAAIAVIHKIQREPVIEKIWNIGKKIKSGINDRIKKYKLSGVVTVCGSPPWSMVNFNKYKDISSDAIKTFFIVEMLKKGILTFGTHNISYAHTADDIDNMLSAYDYVFNLISIELEKGVLEKNLEVPVIQPVFQVRNAIKSN
jgi:glutamate-1-semialdehyde 2,1-aminomutase/spore coat polysaccharide biosynthesis protein SpsF